MRDRLTQGLGAGLRIPRRAGHSVLAGLAFLVCPAAASATTLTLAETVMTGLANPRGLAFGPAGALYVAEAGRGGNGATVPGPDGAPLGYGQSGGISRYQNGVQERVVSGVPSLAGPDGSQAIGVQDVAFDAEGTLHAVIGLGNEPDVRDGALAGEAGADLLGTLVAIENGTPELVADLADFEEENDPDGVGPDSNPFSLVAQGDGFLVNDAGANAVLEVDGSGTIAVQAVIPPGDNPLPIGGPTYQAVPTGTALSPTGELVFGQLTGFPFPETLAQIYTLEGGTLSVLAGGFTNLIDVAFGADGTLYALELDSDGLINPGVNGALYSISSDGLVKLLFDDLINPTGLAIGANGDFFVSINGFSPNEGSVIRLAPIPLPAALPTLIGGLLLLAGWRLGAGSTRRGSSLV